MTRDREKWTERKLTRIGHNNDERSREMDREKADSKRPQ